MTRLRQSEYPKALPKERIKKRRFIKVLVSLGHDLSVTLPDLMSMTKEEIEAWAARKLHKVRITAEHSLDVPVGRGYQI